MNNSDIDNKIHSFCDNINRKSSKKFIVGIILGFGIVGLLGIGFFYAIPTFYDGKKTNLNNIQDSIPVSSEQNDSEAYIYWYAPPDSFGIQSTKTLNKAFFKQKFNQHTDWLLEYKRYEWSDWTEGNQYLTINKTWNDIGNFWKINLTFTAPVDIYSARFTFGCDLPVLQYVEREGYEVWINYTANATENYSVMFNYSDLASIPNLVFSKGVQDNMFWFRFRRDNIPAGVYVFDPTFGNTATGLQGVEFEDDIAGSNYTMGAVGGTADSITALIQVTTAAKDVSAALYYNNRTLVGFAEEKTIPVTALKQWQTFNFSAPKPTVNANEVYYLMVWGDSGDGSVYIYASPVVSQLLQHDFDGYDYPNWKSPFDDEPFVNRYNGSIYCNYTVSGVAPNSAPGQHGNSPTNSSTLSSIPAVCQALYVNVTDVDGDTMNVTWWSNSSNAWVQFGYNNSVTSGTNITQCNNNFTVCNTTYWWSVNVSDGMGNWHNVTYVFNSAWCNSPPTQSGEDPFNSSTIVDVDSGPPDLYVIGYDSDTADKLNATWWGNTSGNWVQFGLTNISFASGTNITQNNANFSTELTKYWWSVNLSDGEGGWDNETYHFTTIANTSWQPLNWSINGTCTNITVWQPINWSINGTCTNTTIWQPLNWSINGTCTNTTTWQTIDFSINGTCTNTTVWQTIDFSINGTCTNTTGIWQPVNWTINGTCTNTSAVPLDISDEHPTNNTLIPYIYPTLFFTINSTTGLNMNYTVYWGDNYDEFIDNGTTQPNGTYYHAFTNASTRPLQYNWSVNLTDTNGNWLNKTYIFTTRYETAGRITYNNTMAIAIASFILLLCFFIIIKKRRKKYYD